MGVGCGVWGFTSFEVANYLIFREKVPKFPPDHCHIQYFLSSKRFFTRKLILHDYLSCLILLLICSFSLMVREKYLHGCVQLSRDCDKT
ncbi:MAG: hypothetical protein EWV84_18800 [Microcystis sp. M_QC_C_20170808_M3Col]|nr:MAG: hypothetical protein EWV84_18800 [Microcystis sp. M_QC_C_20170808_M3Col]